MILEKIKNLKSDYHPKFTRTSEGDIAVSIESSDVVYSAFTAYSLGLILVCILFISFFLFIYSKAATGARFNSGVIRGLVLATLGIILGCLILCRYKIKEKILKLTPDEKYLVRILSKFIRSNRLYLLNSDDKSIICAAVAIAHLDKKRLIIYLSSDGSKDSQKTQNMEVELSSLFGMTLIDKKITASDTAYIFRLHKPRRLTIRDLKIVPPDIPIAIDSEHEWDYTKVPHALIAGRTGGVKTRYLLWIIASFVMRGCADSTFIIDPKKSDIYQLKATSIFPPENFAMTSGEVCRLLRLLNQDMDRCYEKINNSGIYGATYKDVGNKPALLIFDEFTAFFSACSVKEKTEVMRYLKRLILMGRQAGITVVLSTQKPLAEDLPTTIRDNLSCRCAIGGLTDEGYRTVFGSPYNFLLFLTLMN